MSRLAHREIITDKITTVPEGGKLKLIGTTRSDVKLEIFHLGRFLSYVTSAIQEKAIFLSLSYSL